VHAGPVSAEQRLLRRVLHVLRRGKIRREQRRKRLHELWRRAVREHGLVDVHELRRRDLPGGNRVHDVHRLPRRQNVAEWLHRLHGVRCRDARPRAVLVPATADARRHVRPGVLRKWGLLQSVPRWPVPRSKRLYRGGLHRMRRRSVRWFVRCYGVRNLPRGLLLELGRVLLHGLPGWAALGVGLRGVPPVPRWEVC